MNKGIKIAFCLLFVSTLLTSFHKQIFPIRTIEIVGLNFIEKAAVETLVDRNQSVFSLNKDELAKKIMGLDFVDKVHISIQLLDKIIIYVQEKSLVAKFSYNKTNYYLTSKSLILSKKNYILEKYLPELQIKNKLNSNKLALLCYNLELLKFHDLNFFAKINKISFEGSENSNIFITINNKEYVLNSIFKLEDFLKIRLLNNHNLSYNYFDLRENDLIVVKN